MVKNHTVFTGDNLPIMRGMENESVDLIYLDPPFNSNRTYAAPIGSKAAGAAFKDVWTLLDTDDAWWGEIADKHPSLYKVIDAVGEVGGKGDKAYLIYMAMRLLEMRRILKPTGSIYLHCDPTMSHSLKLTMDAVFGGANFKNEITWKRTHAHNDPKRFGNNTDIIFFYSNGDDYNFQPVIIPYNRDYIENFFTHTDKRGAYRLVVLTGPKISSGESDALWRGYRPSQSGRSWSVPRRIVHSLVGEKKAKKMSITDRLDLMYENDYIVFSKNGIPRFKEYLKEMEGMPTQALWVDIPALGSRSKERTGYPTQKPLALLERIIKASSREGDMVFDPFCGCATTLIAAQKHDRQWIGIDISPKAVELVKMRLENELQLFADFIHRTDIPISKVKRSKNIRHTLYGKQEGRCAECKMWFPFKNMTLDHIVPKKSGGPDDDTNLQLLCDSCNSIKGNRPMESLMATLKEKKII